MPLDPLVQAIEDARVREGVMKKTLEENCCNYGQNLKTWQRTGLSPMLATVRKLADFLGYDIILVKKDTTT
jgi:hypothetical protein